MSPGVRTQNWILFGMRAIAVFLLFLLFLDPTIKRVINRVEPPIIAIAIDNSQSIIANSNDSLLVKAAIKKLQSSLEEEEFVVEISKLDTKDSIQFDHRTSNLSSLLSLVDDRNQHKNHVSTILLTDGIYNRGSSPLYKNYVKPIFTVGMGDTIPPRDVSISRVRYNRVSYKGNETPIRVEIKQEGYLGNKVNIELTEKGKLLERKSISLKVPIQDVEFFITNEEEGT